MKRILTLFCATILIATCFIAWTGCGKKTEDETEYEPQNYQITFETNGGSPLSPIEWTAGTPLSVLKTTKDGFIFIGWYYDSALQNAFDASDPQITKDITLYAKWEENVHIPQTFTVSFETNGGTALPSTQWTEGTVLTVNRTEKPGFDFAGWYYDSALQSAVDLDNPQITENTTLYAAWKGKEYSIRLYKNQTDFTELTYMYEEKVDIDAWEIPEPILFEGDECPFLYWMDETLTNVIEDDFTMPAKSLAFYATYDYPQIFNWSYDAETDAYTSGGAGIRPIKNAPQGYYGEYSVDLTVVNATTTGIGIIWNATVSETDKPYDEGCAYWYMHLNPTNGGFQLALSDSTRTPDYDVMKTISLSSAPASWQEKWNAYKAGSDPLSFNFKAVFSPTQIQLYVDNDLLLTYTGENLNKVLGNCVGIRTNTAGNIAQNAHFTPDPQYREVYTLHFDPNLEGVSLPSVLYAAGTPFNLPSPSIGGYKFLGWTDEQGQDIGADFTPASDMTFIAKWVEIELINNFNVYEGTDGKTIYESTAKNIWTTVSDIESTRYGLWEADLYIYDRSTSRIGLLINAYTPAGSVYGDKGANGYYLHHNASANANFTLASIRDGAYTTGGAVVNYNSASSGALGAYYARSKAWLDGETEFVKVRLGIEISAQSIKLYIDGECILMHTNANYLGLFDENPQCVGVGFISGGIGNIFTNFNFIPAEA